MVDGKRTIPAQWSRTSKSGVIEIVPGTLVISDQSPTHVIHLTREFASDDSPALGFHTGFTEVDFFPVLHGQTEDGLFTAIDSRVVGGSQNYGGGKLSDIVLHPYLMIRGSVTLNEHELALTSVRLRFWDQDEWAQWYNLNIKNASKDDETVVIEQVPPPSKSSTLDGVQVAIRDNSSTSYHPIGHGRILINQTSVFRLEFDEEIPLREFLEKWMAPLSFWVSSGSRRTSGIEFMSIQNRNWTNDRDATPVTSWLSVITRNPKRKFTSEDKIQFLHRLNDFDFERQLPILLSTFTAHRTALDQYLDYLHTKPGTPMVQLTVLAQLVETFDRSLDPDPLLDDDTRADAQALADYVASNAALKKHARDAKRAALESIRPNLASRLRRLDDATDKIVGEMLGAVDWKSSVASIRNSIVHGLPSSAFFLTNVIPIQISVDILELLFELRLLLALGFSKDEARKIMTVDDPRWAGKTYNMKTYLSSFEDFKQYKPEDS